MDYTQFLYMHEELALLAVIVIMFIYDLVACSDRKGGKPVLNTAVPVVLMAVLTVVNAVPCGGAAEAFGGMYQYTPMMTIMKTVLNIGTLIVFLMAHSYLRREENHVKQGEFYILTLSTLLGMYLMISAGHFIMFFIGLELASVPMTALVAFDKWRSTSAEAGAKYILVALFSSSLLLYGISMIYGATGTMYFNDLAGKLDGSMLNILGLVFFFTGMGFKISLVPFHLWTADVYEGSPTVITSYLSVISKGAAGFVLLHARESFCPDDKRLAGNPVLDNNCFNYHCQPLCTSPEQHQTIHGVLRNFAGRLPRARRNSRHCPGHDILGVLPSCIPCSQPRCICGYQCGGTKQRQDMYKRIQRSL